MPRILNKVVREECANLVRGECLGLDVWNVRFRDPGPCGILANKPCGYFREVLIPTAKVRGEYAEVLRAYRKLDERMEGEDIRRCECGKELLPRKRLCERCARGKRMKSYREQKQRERQQAVLQSGDFLDPQPFTVQDDTEGENGETRV